MSGSVLHEECRRKGSGPPRAAGRCRRDRRGRGGRLRDAYGSAPRRGPARGGLARNRSSRPMQAAWSATSGSVP